MVYPSVEKNFKIIVIIPATIKLIALIKYVAKAILFCV